VLGKSVVIDPKTKAKKALIQRVRWTNIGFSKTPVNANLPSVSTVPIGALTKSWGADGLDLAKALEAGAETDMAQAEGGGALVKQSLDRKLKSYWEMRDSMADAVRSGKVKANPAAMSKAACKMYGLSQDESAEFVERFMGDLQSAIKRG